jgi:uncharacterized protein YgfB (UPF0149 family)
MTPDYSMMQQLLHSKLPDCSPAALHGLITGLLSSGAPDIDEDDVSSVLQQEFVPVTAQLVERLITNTRERLQEPDYSFQLLLPLDDEQLSQRVLALGDWCEGFTTGFAAGFALPESALSSEGRESLTDIGQFANLSEEAIGEQEEDEADYVELVEYVRMAVIALFQHLAQADADDADGEPASPNDNDDGEDRLLH